MEIRWAVDNALNFTPHAAVFMLAVAAYGIFGRQWVVTIASLLLVVVAGSYMLRADSLLARAESCGAAPRLRIATFNTQGGEADFDSFGRFLEDKDVQIVILEEMTFMSSFRARSLYERYPYRLSSRPGWVQIISTVPFEDADVFDVFGETQARDIWRVTIADPLQTEIHFFHAQTSRSAALHRVRTRQYTLLEELLGNAETPAIVAGDMNATILDPTFAGMLRATGLRSAVAGHHDTPSWPANLGFLGIRIDHVLQRGFNVCSVTIGPSIGSDHRPVAVELAQRSDSQGTEP